MRFENVISSVMSLFTSAGWKVNNIPAFPGNYTEIRNNEYVRVNTILGNSTIFNQHNGLISVDIFVPTNTSVKRTTQIADMLSNLLECKTTKLSEGTLQTSQGSLSNGRLDSASSTLWRATYSIPFTFYEV